MEGGISCQIVNLYRLGRTARARIIRDMEKTKNKESESQADPRVATVSRVTDDTIIELVYDAGQRRTGLVVSRFDGLWNVEQEVKVGDEILVPYSPRNNLIANECVLLPSMPVQSGSKQELIADIQSFLHRYVDLSPLFERIAAHYVLLTWLNEAFGELPYLRLRGEYGTGKTRGLMAIGSLCYKGFFASAASTVSPIFHILDTFGGTLLLDEADLPFSDARVDIVKIFNNGTVKGMPVLRTIVNRQKEYNPRAFKVFGPKVIAMRGSFDDPALESRFITEETGTRELRADIPIQLPNSLKTEALELRNRLLHYRLCNLFKTKPDIAALMPDVEPRLNQTAISLLSLVDDPELRSQIQGLLREEDKLRKSERGSSADVWVLDAAREAFANSKSGDISLQQIAGRFNAAHEADYASPMTPKWIGYVLREKWRIPTRKSHGIYVVARSERPKIEALSARYTD